MNTVELELKTVMNDITKLELYVQVCSYNTIKNLLLKASIDMTCEHGTVHLVGGDAISRGRVEYCFEGDWYSVCANDWHQEETDVVCKSLGFNTGFGKLHSGYNTLCKTNNQSVSVASNFGRGTNPILPKSIQCSTDDPTFSDCNTTDLNVSQCQHVAGVICEGVYYSYHPHCVFTVLSAYFSALCLTVGHTDCEKCGSHRHCNIDYICNCYSDCYAYGSCCPDVSYVENCVG